VRRYESPSSLGLLAKCGPAYAFRYVEGIKTKPRKAMAVGLAVDAGATRDYETKQATGSALAEAELIETARDRIVSLWADGEIDERDLEQEQAPVDEVVTLATAHHRVIVPDVAPIGVQERLTVELDGFPFGLLGIADVLDGKRDGIWVRDTKTGKRRPDPLHSLQLVIYSLAIVGRGQTVSGAALDYVLPASSKRSAGAEVLVRPAPTQDEYDRLFRRLEAAARTIETGSFMPASRDAWWCSADWCGYWTICKHRI
jgi:RecB family exonuclease